MHKSTSAVFFSDNGHSFDQVLFFGQESTLMTFDLLLFVVVDMAANSFILAAVITYFVDEVSRCDKISM